MKAPAVYLLASQKNGTLYLGVTSDLIARVGQHREGNIAGFTHQYGVKTLVWYEQHETIESAINREKTLKGWRRSWKIELIEDQNPRWNDLWFELVEQTVAPHNANPPRHPRERGDPGATHAETLSNLGSRVRGNDECTNSTQGGSRVRRNDEVLRAAQKECRKSTLGFTLIELLLVIGIMAVITSIVAVQIVGSLDSAKVASAGRDLMAAMRYTRSAALLQHQSQAVIFDVEKKTYQVPGKEPVELPEAMEIIRPARYAFIPMAALPAGRSSCQSMAAVGPCKWHG
jgi:putative endonuclease